MSKKAILNYKFRIAEIIGGITAAPIAVIS
jgi:hypothetical protein